MAAHLEANRVGALVPHNHLVWILHQCQDGNINPTLELGLNLEAEQGRDLHRGRAGNLDAEVEAGHHSSEQDLGQLRCDRCTSMRLPQQ